MAGIKSQLKMAISVKKMPLKELFLLFLNKALYNNTVLSYFIDKKAKFNSETLRKLKIKFILKNIKKSRKILPIWY
ncbi:hypothetical protein [Flavobacterium sp.]|uniref:hypothetical protein n=1 Tax=Flavobacterium sp. TaxID=239 RepID=UPI003D6B4DBF